MAVEMNGWERNGKLWLKGFLWAPVYLGSAMWLGLTPSWQLLAFYVICGVWAAILDGIWPTDKETAP